MSRKNTLEAKALRRANKNKDRGYPSYWSTTAPTEKYGYTKLVPYGKTPISFNPLTVAMRGFVMNHWFNLLGLTK